MAAVIDVMARAENLPLSCELPAMRPFAFHYPVGPRVVIKLDCVPDAIREQASAQLTQGQKVMTGPKDGGWPWVDRADAGGQERVKAVRRSVRATVRRAAAA